MLDNTIRQKFCKMITLSVAVLDLLEAEPNPEILKEQVLHLINTILVCCEDYKNLK